MIDEVQPGTFFVHGPSCGSQAKFWCTQAAVYWTVNSGDGSRLLTALSCLFIGFCSFANSMPPSRSVYGHDFPFLFHQCHISGDIIFRVSLLWSFAQEKKTTDLCLEQTYEMEMNVRLVQAVCHCIQPNHQAEKHYLNTYILYVCGLPCMTVFLLMPASN